MTVPERFRRMIVTHALAATFLPDYPLLLAVVGPPGDGKSYQTNLTLTDNAFTTFRLSGAELGGRSEGRPVEQMRSLYLKARDHARLNGSRPALILEDFDLSPAGQSSNARYTVNSQLLTGFLMNLADDVTMCDVGTDARYPIFITTNNLSTLHGPLTRPGRMSIFTWDPDPEERTVMVYSVLRPRVPSLTIERARLLAAKHSGKPISAFSAAVSTCQANRIYQFVTHANRVVNINELKRFATMEIALEEVEAVLAQKRPPRGLLNFLRESVNG